MKKSIGLIFSLLILCIASRAQYVTLTLNLVKGETYYHAVTANASIIQTVNGVQNTIATTVTGKIAYKVIDTRDSLYDIELRYENLSMKMQMPGGTMDASSEKPAPADPISEILAAVKNQRIIVIMTKTGKLKSISGVDDMFNHIIDNYTGLTPDKKQQIKGMLQQSFGDKAIKGNFEMGTAIFPAVPVKKNALWTIDTQLETATPANVHAVYELRDITETHYFIHCNARIDYPSNNAYVETNGMQLKYKLSGFMSTDMVVNRATGWLKESKISQKISGETQIKESEKIPGGMMIPMTMSSDITITDR